MVELGTHYANRIFYVFLYKEMHGNQGEVCRQLKVFYHPPPPIVYATNCSKSVIPVLLTFCVTLWLILRGASCFGVFSCSLYSCFVIPFSIMITSLGVEGAGLCASSAFVCLFCTCCHLCLPLGIGGWLRFVTVALP